eukprot:gene11447-15335_t
MSFDHTTSRDIEIKGGKESNNENNNCTSLFVGNLSRIVKNGHLEEIFGTYGSIKGVDLDVDRKTGIPRGNATITFYDEKDAEQAKFYMDGGQIDGRIIKVSFVLVSKLRNDGGNTDRFADLDKKALREDNKKIDRREWDSNRDRRDAPQRNIDNRPNAIRADIRDTNSPNRPIRDERNGRDRPLPSTRDKDGSNNENRFQDRGRGNDFKSFREDSRTRINNRSKFEPPTHPQAVRRDQSDQQPNRYTGPTNAERGREPQRRYDSRSRGDRPVGNNNDRSRSRGRGGPYRPTNNRDNRSTNYRSEPSKYEPPVTKRKRDSRSRSRSRSPIADTRRRRVSRSRSKSNSSGRNRRRRGRSVSSSRSSSSRSSSSSSSSSRSTRSSSSKSSVKKNSPQKRRDSSSSRSSKSKSRARSSSRSSHSKSK